jgi:hypothetical protein
VRGIRFHAPLALAFALTALVVLRAVANDGPKERDPADSFLRNAGETLLHPPLEAIDWILIAVIAGIVIRAALLLMARSRPGKVEIAPVTVRDPDDPKAGPDPRVAFTMKATLNELGVGHAPAVPAGAMRNAPVAVIEDQGLARARMVFELMIAVLEWLRPKTGYRVSGVIERIGVNRRRLSLEIASRYDGHVIATPVVEGESTVEAAQSAARRVYKAVTSLGENVRGTPLWTRWVGETDKALEHYSRGIALELEGAWEEAAKEHGQASLLEPSNAVAALRCGNALERVPDLTGALEVYLRVVSLWPQLLEARYRLAVAYAASIKPAVENGQAAAERALAMEDLRLKLEELAPLVARARRGVGRRDPGLHRLPVEGQDLNTWLGEEALRQWEILRSQLRWWNLLVAWTGFTSPTAWRAGWRRYLGPFVRPIGGEHRRVARMAVLMARRATGVHMADPREGRSGDRTHPWLNETERKNLAWIERRVTPSLARRLVRLFHDAGIDWRVRYNAVCFYAALHGLVEARVRNEGSLHADPHRAAQRYGVMAVDQLYEVLQRPGSQEVWTWIHTDPDLAPLRDTGPGEGHDDLTVLIDAMPREDQA